MMPRSHSARIVLCGVLVLVLIPLLAACPDKKQQVGQATASKPLNRGQAPPPPSVPESGPLAQKIRFEQAKSLLRAGRPEQAVTEFRHAIDADPTGKLLASCYLGLGSAHGDLKRHAQAVKAFQKVVELEPSDPEGFRALAIGLEDAGRLREARQALQQALALDPDQLSAYQDLAGLHLKEKDMEGAKQAYLGYELTRTRLIRTLGLARDEKPRVRAAQALGDARDEATTKALGLALTDRSREVRLAVIRSLGQQHLAEGAGPLRRLLSRTRDAEERRLIQLSLQAIETAPQPPPQSAPSAVESGKRGDSGAGTIHRP